MANKLKVVVSNFSPLIFKENGKYVGFEIELWETIAKKISMDFEYEEHAFPEIISLIANKKADVGLAGITINERREKIVDFSHPTLSSGLLILTNKDRRKIKVWESIKFIFQEGYKAIVNPLLLVLSFVVIFAHLLWFTEKGAKTFSNYYFPGIFESAWLVICSMSTDSFGDYVPHTWVGRIITTGIIVGGVAIFGLFIAQITAFIAIKKIKGDINSYRDLAHKNVATVKDSTSVATLQKIGAHATLVLDIKEAYTKLKDNTVDAIVFDAPVLTYYAENKGKNIAEIVGELFDKQNYGIVLQTNSTLREQVNQTILLLKESGQYDVIYRKWFGENSLLTL